MTIVAQSIPLSPASRRALERLAGDATRVFGDRFDALVAYEPHRAVLFATSVTPVDLGALAPLAEVWHRDGLHTPLVMTRDEFRRSLDAFPLEYQAILDRHVIVAGGNPFDGAVINIEDLRRACEVQAKAHLIHLRQGWIEAGGHPHELAELVAEASAPWRILLENVARLRGVDAPDRRQLATWAAGVTGLPIALLEGLLAAGDEPATASRLVDQLPEYIAGAGRLWTTIDAWKV